MYKKLIVFLFIVFLFIPCNALAINLNTSSLIAMDIDSGRVFYEKNADNQRLIASTTKIMTALIAIENSNLTDIVKAEEEVLTMYGTNIYIEYQESMLLLDLIYGLMLRSGNDAAVVIAKHVGGSTDNFTLMMNEKAKELGMHNTIFNNPHGLDEETENYSTARDLSILYSYAYKNEVFRKIVGTKVWVANTDYKSYKWYNRMELLKLYDKATGGKTGYTPRAGKVLVSSASNNDLDIVISSFNSIYDYDLHMNVYEDIFNNYRNYLIVDKDDFKINYNIDKGKIYIKESFSYPLTKKEYDNLDIKVDINDKLEEGKIGEMYIYLDEKIIKEIDIYLTLDKESFIDRIKKLFSL